MRELSFYCEAIPEPGQRVALSSAEATHAVRVLRVQPGREVRLCDGAGVAAAAVVESVTPSRRASDVQCRVCRRQQHLEPARVLWLCVAVPRAKQMTQIVRQATELGVHRITPIVCERGVARPGGVSEHWHTEVVSAAKQSGNVFFPTLDVPVAFGEALAAVPALGFFGDTPAATAAAPPCGPAAGVVPLWVGPEGGFSERERRCLVDRGCVGVSVGRWVLRVETAVVALLSWLLAEGHAE